MTIRFYRADGITPLDGSEFTALQAGQLSNVLTVRVRAEGAEALEVLVLQRVESPTEAGAWLAQGVPPQDELWGRVRVVGEENTADPTWQAPRTDWQPLGAFAGLLLPRIPEDCDVILEWAQQPPSSAEIEAYNWGLTSLYGEHSRAVPPAVTMGERGVLPGTGDGETSLVLRGLEVTASAVPDDEVHVVAGIWQHLGDLYGDIGRTVALDQDDSAAETLAVGEAYIALLSRGASPDTVTVTKGTKAVAPVAPEPAAGEDPIAEVRVEHQAGGISVIDAADITDRRAFGRFEVRPGTGRQLIIARGQGLAGGTWRYAAKERLVVPDDDATSWLWILANGLPELTLTTARPEAAGLLLAEADVAAGAVTAIRDRRRYVGGEVVLRLHGTGAAAPQLVDDLLLEHEVLALERVVFRISDHTGATAGETVADVELDGASIFTDQATEDLRPRIAWDASELVDSEAIHQVTTLRRGQLVAFHLDAVATDADPATAELLLICRRP